MRWAQMWLLAGSGSSDVSPTWASLILFRVPVRLSLRVSRLEELSVWRDNSRTSVEPPRTQQTQKGEAAEADRRFKFSFLKKAVQFDTY